MADPYPLRKKLNKSMKMSKIKNHCNIDCSEIGSLKNVLSNLYDDNELIQRSEIFKALADSTRLQILYLLKLGDLYVCEIMSVLEKPQSTTSHHLNVLKNAGFIEGYKKGIWILYSLKRPEIVDLMDDLCPSYE